MKRLIVVFVLGFAILSLSSCRKENTKDDALYQYYEVGFKRSDANWRDTSFVVRTSSQSLIQQMETQLSLPLSSRKLVVGTLVAGSAGYNKNATHEFQWHFKEDDWQLADVTVEIYDGRPHTDVDVNLSYWLNTVKRFGAWGSYIKKKLPSKP